MIEPFVIMDQIIIILLAGVVAAKISERFGLPSIIPLFIIGYLVGPEGLGIFVPLSLGLSLSAVVTLAIPVILFDEGMRIDLKLLNEFKLTVFLLATLAVVVSTWKVTGKGLDPKNVKIDEIMSIPLITIDPDADLTEAAKIMKKHKIRRLAVVREGTLQGILTALDIARNLENYVDEEMRDILRYLWTPRYSPQEG